MDKKVSLLVAGSITAVLVAAGCSWDSTDNPQPGQSGCSSAVPTTQPASSAPTSPPVRTTAPTAGPTVTPTRASASPTSSPIIGFKGRP